MKSNTEIKEEIKLKIEQIQNAVPNLEIDKFSRITCDDDKAYVHPPQILASLNCIYNMILAKIYSTFSRCNMLYADMQAGKTGSIGNVIYLLNRYEELRKFLGIEWSNCHFVTSMSDNANIEQLKNELISQSNYRKDSLTILNKERIIHNPTMNANLKKKEEKEKLQNFSNGILFIDEAHLAPFNKSVLYKFTKTCGVSLNGYGDIEMKSKNTFLFTVSATPYDERVGNKLYDNKNLIELETVESYKGLKYFYDNGLLRDSFELSTPTGIENFHKVLKSFEYKKGYYIVRLNKGENYGKLVPKGFSKKNYFFENKENINITLLKPPTKPTIIFVKGKMKQSFQLEKSNIVMMFDRTAKNSKYRTNFVVQSFVGRSCGYHDYKYIIYADIENVKNHIDFTTNPENIPQTKFIGKKIFNSTSSSKLEVIDFSNNIPKFNQLSALEGTNDKYPEIVDILLSITDMKILKDYKSNNSIYDSNYFYSESKNKSYKEYITNSYHAIETTDGLSNKKFFDGRRKELYNIGDNVFAIYVDLDNYKVIVAHKTITNLKDESFYYDINDDSSFSKNDMDIEINQVNKKARIILEGVLNVNDKIKMHYNRNNEMVLPKNTKVEKKKMKKNGIIYIQNNKVIRDYKIPCITPTTKRNAIKKIVRIISSNIAIDDFLCDGKPFISFF